MIIKQNYTYDEFNNLIKVKDYDDVIYEYTYDGLGHRLSQSVNKTYKEYINQTEKQVMY